jgi:hypothetical protein
MKHIQILLMSLFLTLSFNSIANEEVKQEIKKEVAISQETSINEYYEAQIILNNIDQLIKDGFITDKNAQEAKAKYVFQNKELKERMKNYVETANDNKNIEDTEASWSEYITFLNIMKFVAVIILIIAFHGFIANFATALLALIVSVPIFAYQTVFMASGIVMTFFPELIWESQSFYLAFFGSFLNIIILFWISVSYEDFFKKIISKLSIGIKPDLLVCIYGALYFGSLAIMYSSSAFGLLTVGFIVTATGFVIYHSSLCVALGVEKEEHLGTAIISNLIILVTYSLIKINGIDIPHLEHFSVGIEYLCSLALGICLLIASSPMLDSNKNFGLATFLMFLCSGLALAGSVFFGLTTIAAFLNTIFVLYILEWIGYMSEKSGWVAFMFTLGSSLYGLAILLEKYPQYFVNSLI